MAALGPSDTPEEPRKPSLGARLRASEAFADVRDYVRTGLELWDGRGVAAAPSRDPGPDTQELDSGNIAGSLAGGGRRRILVVSLLIATGLAGLAATGVLITGGPPSVGGSTGVEPSPASSTTDRATHDGADSEPSASVSRSAGHRTPSPSATATGIRPVDPTAPGADPTRPSDPTSSPASSPSSKPDDDDDDDDDDGKPDKPTPTKTRPTRPARPAAGPPSHAEPGTSPESAPGGGRQR